MKAIPEVTKGTRSVCIRLGALRRMIREAIIREGGEPTGASGVDPSKDPKRPYDYDIDRGVDVHGFWYKSPGRPAGTEGDPGRPADAAEYIGMKRPEPEKPAGEEGETETPEGEEGIPPEETGLEGKEGQTPEGKPEPNR